MIRKLPLNLINQIAAGEVVERPAAVVKELVENSIDAGATNIVVTIRNGGQALIQVSDDGSGIDKENLPLTIERYATSKLPDDNLFAIHSFGFRGEALAAIGAVSRLCVTSRIKNEPQAWAIAVEGGTVSPLEPARHNPGTTVDVKDLFYAVPARLKFMRTPSTEMQHIHDILRKISLIHPHIGFVLKDDKKEICAYNISSLSDPDEQFLERAEQVLGTDFRLNSFVVDYEQDGIRIKGLAGIPTFNRANGSLQYLYVNQRPIRDKMISSVLRVSYQDYLASNRFPVAILSVTLPEDEIDVNVHPAKTEVRFRDGNLIRGILYKAIKNGLASASQRTSTTIHTAALETFMNRTVNAFPPRTQAFSHRAQPFFASPPRSVAQDATAFTPSVALSSTPSVSDPLDLGRPVAQIFETYILSATDQHLFMIDQHAAHERLVYERMKMQIQKEGGIRRQLLLLPETITLSDHEVDKLLSVQLQLVKYGLVLTAPNAHSIVITEVPVILRDLHLEKLVRDLLDEISVHKTPLALQEAVETMCGTLACHGSIRAGKYMTMPEMEALLRQMEETPYSGQCNHGRPTYIRLHKYDIEKLFDRR